MEQLTIEQARRMAIAAQGLNDARPGWGRADRRHLRKVFDRVGVIQVDSVNVLVRSQELPLFARLGPHSRRLIPDAVDDGELFEYWAHMAAILPSAHHRLHRWRMAGAHEWGSVERLNRTRPGFVDGVVEQIRTSGAITAGDLAQRVGPKGSWWDWDDGKLALEYLFHHGALAARRRRNDFARLYDLPERVIAPAALAAPTPPEPEARKELLVLAARSLGVGTLTDLTDYHRQNTPTCRPLAKELVAEGRLVAATVDGWKQPAFVHPDAALPRRVTGRALLSPFDSLVWNRDRNERLFDFHYRIEIYTPAPKRVYGYYVLPFLLDGRLVGRVDLKADRAAGVLRVQGAFAEPGIDERVAAAELAGELRLMAGWLELDVVGTTDRGELARRLAREGIAELGTAAIPAG